MIRIRFIIRVRIRFRVRVRVYLNDFIWDNCDPN